MSRPHSKILFLFLVILYLSARVLLYGDPRLSIGTNDTGTYVNSSKEKLSINFLAQKRPLTVPLLYKLFTPQDGYTLKVIGQPATEGEHDDKQYQVGFDGVVLAQMVISMLSWVSIAWVFYKRLRTPLTKVVSTVLIFLFALSPHVAEWDSILQSESLHISLFVLFAALSLEFLFYKFENNIKRPKYIALVVLMTITLILWEYTRDANMYSVAFIWILLVFVMVWLYVKKKRIFPELIIAGGLILISVVTHSITMNQSERWMQPLMSNIKNNVLPL